MRIEQGVKIFSTKKVPSADTSTKEFSLGETFVKKRYILYKGNEVYAVLQLTNKREATRETTRKALQIARLLNEDRENEANT